jgi:hypothetical protein
MDVEAIIGVAEGGNSESGERTLVYFPIVHTQADMGALGESIQRLKVKRLGRRGWARNVNLVDKLWAQIEQALSVWRFLTSRFASIKTDCRYVAGKWRL